MNTSIKYNLVRIADAVENINDNAIPDPSEANEGDVLTIGSNGPEWDAPSGGSDVFIIKTLPGATSADPYVLDKNIAEIGGAIADGKALIVQDAEFDYDHPDYIAYVAAQPTVRYNDRNSTYEVFFTISGNESVYRASTLDGVLTEVIQF